MAESVDATDLKSVDFGHAGSSPAARTNDPGLAEAGLRLDDERCRVWRRSEGWALIEGLDFEPG